MKYQVLFILNDKTTIENARNIKLSLMEQSIDMSIVSDYPIFIPDKEIYIGDYKFNIISKNVKITKDYHTTEVNVLDALSVADIEKSEENAYYEYLTKEMLKKLIR